MTIVSFPSNMEQGFRSWSRHELEKLVSVYEIHAARGDAAAWEVGATEFGDPQFYVVGPAPEHECVLALSRVGRIYVLENGTGRVIEEGASLDTVAARARMPITQYRRVGLLARLTLGLAALRLTFEERLEPILVESEELLVRLAPQLAAFV